MRRKSSEEALLDDTTPKEAPNGGMLPTPAEVVEPEEYEAFDDEDEEEDGGGDGGEDGGGEEDSASNMDDAWEDIKAQPPPLAAAKRRLVPPSASHNPSPRIKESIEHINEELLGLAAEAQSPNPVVPPTSSSISARYQPLSRSADPNGLRSYTRLVLPSNKLVKRAAQSAETVKAIRMLTKALALRAEYVPVYTFFPSPCVFPPSKEIFQGETWGSSEPRFCPDTAPILPNLNSAILQIHGVFVLYISEPEKLENWPPKAQDGSVRTPLKNPSGSKEVLDLIGWKHTSFETYTQHLRYLMKVAQDPVCKSFCYQRCKHLEERFSFHILFNGPSELEEVRNNCHRDFYNVRKVDTHVHHSACMTQKHLLRFIRRKYRTCGDEPVCYADEQQQQQQQQQLLGTTLQQETSHAISCMNNSRAELSEESHDAGHDNEDSPHDDSNLDLSSFSPESRHCDERGATIAESQKLMLQMSPPRRPDVYATMLTSNILLTTVDQQQERPEPLANVPERRVLTLKQLFQEELGLSAWQVSIDHLDVHAINSCFHRFDIFNTKYNPFGAAKLREVFLKTDNMLKGRYLAELTREVIEDLEKAKYQQVEWRVSIYGHSHDEWLKLARWILNNKLESRRVRWIIQVPRLYHIYRKHGKIESMAQLLSNIFKPVMDAVLHPEDNLEIFKLLFQVVGWDSVDDESAASGGSIDSSNAHPTPQFWTHDANPPYEYWMYYMYANIKQLNALLQLRGMSPLPFRPHCGEAGSVVNLCAGGLLADNINHGIMLRKTPVLTYLYFLWQIKIAVSPLSNNALFHEIRKTPFHKFFKIGHHLSLSTDDPLMFHFTDESLLEEYSVMTHMFKFTQVDLCELARNSVLQSNFEIQFKKHWIGETYLTGGNHIQSTNVPDIRIAYRKQTLKDEFRYLRDILKHARGP